jgi:AraC-like DNA-binding protein
MEPTLFTLPEDFGMGSNDTLIHFYSNHKSSVNNKVIFKKNMFCLLQHGVKEVQTATGKEKITNSDLLMLTSGSTLMSESVAKDNKYEAILIFFDNKILSDFCSKRGIKFNKKRSKNSILKIRRDDFLNNYCTSLQLLHKQKNSEINDMKVQEILGYVSIQFPETFLQLVTQALADKSDLKLKQVVELNSNKGLTIDELAFLCNMSSSTFKRHFAAIYNMPPQKYFTQQKMEQAKSYLASRKRPSEIYLDLGYENLSAFSNEFKKYFGISPSKFQTK